MDKISLTPPELYGNIGYSNNISSTEKRIGFDCCHKNDLLPLSINNNNEIIERYHIDPNKKYRNYEYVKKELLYLKEQVVNRY